MNKLSQILSATLLLFFVFQSVVFAQDLELGPVQGSGGYQVTSREITGEGSGGRVLADILSNTIGFFTIIASVFFIFHFITGAFKWTTAGGEAAKAEEARTKMTNATIGLVITVAAYSIIYIIGLVLGLDILDIGKQVSTLGPSGSQ
jgi:hypothetical protein